MQAVVPGDAAEQAEALGAIVVERLPALGQAVIEVTAGQRGALEAAGVPVWADRALEPTARELAGTAIEGISPLASLDLPPGSRLGDGVGLALLDTGVDRRAPLRGRVVAGFDATGEGDPLRDGFGHGTFLAGLLLGIDAPGDRFDVAGVSPGVAVTSVRVAHDDGTTTLVDVLEGIDWTVRHASSRGVRVLLLALGVPRSAGSSDPLHAALEVAWASGLTVVVPTGNTAGTVTSPGDDPWLVTVGASDGDHTAVWSGSGNGQPAVLAPGVGLASASVPGSRIARSAPGGTPRLVSGSGSSLAAALVAGACSIVIAAHPGATPDDVKGALVSTARAASPALQVDVARAVAAPWSATWVQHHPLDPLLGLDVDAMPWVGAGAAGWTGTSWTGTSWTGTSWTGTSWTGTSWTGTSWTGTSWTGTSWTAQP